MTLVMYLFGKKSCDYKLSRIIFFRPYREFIDSQKGMSSSHYSSGDEESAKILSSSVPLSVLLIPSLKEVSSLCIDFILFSKQYDRVKFVF